MKIYDRDGWLKPFKSIIDKQHDKTVAKVELLTNNNQISLVDFANGYSILDYIRPQMVGFSENGHQMLLRYIS